MLDDVLALPDIPEVDSRKLSELCRILNALEGLFVETDASANAHISPDSDSVSFNFIVFQSLVDS